MRQIEREVDAILSELPGEVSLTIEVLSGDRARPPFKLSRRPEAVYPAASLIKLPVLLTVLEASERGELSLDLRIPVGGEGTGGAGIIERFRPGTDLTLGDLLVCMIAVSDNAAANHVIDLVGMEAVNAFSARLGLKATALRRKMMDWEARAQGRENTTSPADLHRLLCELRKPRSLSPAVAARARALLAAQQFKLGWATFLPEERLAHKTGDLAGVFHDAGLLDPEGPATVVYTHFSAGVPNIGESSVAAGRIGRAVADWLDACAREEGVR